MATIRGSRISTAFKYSRISGIPELNLDPLEWSYSDVELQSVASFSTVVSERVAKERRKISRTEGCFVTKITGFHLEMAHWVNAVRKNADLKAYVERFLHALHIVARDFSLDSACNLTLLDRNLHYTLDKLGFFAITCSKETLKALIELVEEENQKYVNRRGCYFRDFELTGNALSTATYEFVLLHPNHLFQKKGSALTVFTEIENGFSGKMYLVSPDGALRDGSSDNDQRLPAFTSNGGREPDDILHPFLVVLNADVAFRRFRRNPRALCRDYEELIDLTIELANKIYFPPIVNAFLRNFPSVPSSGPSGQDVEMADVSDEFGARPGVDNNRTITPRDRAGNSRTGRVVRRPGPGASHDEVMEYQRYLISGCDYFDEGDEIGNGLDFESDDEDDADNRERKGNPPERALPTQAGRHDVQSASTFPDTVHEKVERWQVEVS